MNLILKRLMVRLLPLAFSPLSFLMIFCQAAKRPVHHVNMKGMSLGSEKIANLIGKLPLSSYLASAFVSFLLLDGNDIDAEGARTIAEFLKQDKHVVSLSLKWNSIGAFSHSPLTSLPI